MKALGDDRRSFSYYKAIPVIEKLPFKIENVEQVKHLPSIGKSMQDHVSEHTLQYTVFLSLWSCDSIVLRFETITVLLTCLSCRSLSDWLCCLDLGPVSGVGMCPSAMYLECPIAIPLSVS